MPDSIVWTTTSSGGGKKRKFWGVTEAADDNQIAAAFAEQWRKVFLEVLPWYPPEKWNTLHCGVNAYEGTFDFAPLLDFDLRKSLPGCHLKFDALEGRVQDDFDTDEEFEEVCQAETERYLGLLMRGWEQARGDKEVADRLKALRIPFRAIDSPEPAAKPLVETVLETSGG